jgi:hypothetical protein
MRHRRLVLPTALAIVVAFAALSATSFAGDPGYTDPYSQAAYCRHEPKHHVRGMRRTPFKVCVGAMKQLKRHRTLSPKRACRHETKRRPRGARRSPYTACVRAGTRLRRGQPG